MTLSFSSRAINAALKVAGLVIISVMTSCAGIGGKSDRTNFLQHDYPIQLMSPESLGRTITLAQQIKITQNENMYRLRSVLHVDPKHVQLLLQNSFGQRLATIIYDGDELSVTKIDPVFSDALPNLETLLKVTQMVLWPALEIKTQGLNVGWNINQDGRTRRILNSNQLVVEIKYSSDKLLDGGAVFYDPIRNYELEINSNTLDSDAP